MSFFEVKNLNYEFEKYSFFSKKSGEFSLKDINLDVKEGEILGLLGCSGCGKSTLAKNLIGLLKSKSAQIYLNGDRARLNGIKRRREFYRQVQIVFQDSLSAVNPSASVYEVIEEPLKNLSGLSKSEQAARIKELLKSLKIDEKFLYKKARSLSGGQLQRVCIARAMAIKPKLLILDEALSSLDATLAVEFLKLLKDIKKQTSILLITHDLRLVRLVCDRVVLMDDGRIVERASGGDKFTSKIGKELENAVLLPPA
jgi:hypothetical protein